MNFDGLERNYWNSQITRISNLRDKINLQVNTVSKGNIIPEDSDLTLGEGRRLKMAVLFLDISRFSARDLETEVEQSMMLRALNLFFSEMIKIAEDYGGTVEKNTGDGLMAYFEDNSFENGSKRAVACALTMFAANEHLISPILNASKILPFDFRISIDYGYVTIAKLGAARRFSQYVAIGTTANFAAKMLNNAAPNEIVIGELAKNALPFGWQTQYTTILQATSGWVYKKSGLPYNLYKYIGRWINLIG
jgi:class 3 adenylate cyclase